MRSKIFILLAIAPLAAFPLEAQASISLGTAGNFAVLAYSTVTNTGNTVINGGDVGLSPGTSVTGFPPGTITPPYTEEIANQAAQQAQTDLTTAYNAAAGYAGATVLTGDLGGMTLTPGVYSYSSSAGLTGTLTLNDQGNSNAQFIFQIGSTLTTAAGSATTPAAAVVTINSTGAPSSDCNIYWQVGSSATLGTYTAFEGHILAYTSVTMDTGATITDGSALASTGAVTLDANTINNCAASISSIAVPLPATLPLVFFGTMLLGLPAMAMRSRKRRLR